MKRSPDPMPPRERDRPAWLPRLAGRLHADQSGSISIVSVFALLLLVFLLGLVMNAGRQVDQKVKLRNAADSASYAGGVVMARGMNTLAFTNHLLCDVFAITAFMREARDNTLFYLEERDPGHARSMAPEILDNWERVGPAFVGSEFPRFDRLGHAINEKVPHEREMVETFSDWCYAQSEIMLPVFEEILAQRMIPEFQRALVQATPRHVQYATDEIARRHGQAWPRTAPLHGVLWRTIVDPVGGFSEGYRRTLPVVDPVRDAEPNQQQYFADAHQQRDNLAHTYLRHWNDERLRDFDLYGKMSQFANLWRIFACGQLEKLLAEYPDSNLPFQIRDKIPFDANQDFSGHLEQDFMFVGVVYRPKLDDRIPGIFTNPIASDTQAYAQIMLFIPGRGQARRSNAPASQWPANRWVSSWSLVNQSWNVHLAPGTAASIPQILSTQPYVNNVPTYQLPNLSGLSPEDLQSLSHH